MVCLSFFPIDKLSLHLRTTLSENNEINFYANTKKLPQIDYQKLAPLSSKVMDRIC